MAGLSPGAWCKLLGKQKSEKRMSTSKKALEHVAALDHFYPRATYQIASMIRDRKTLGDWPDWCFLPMSAFFAIIADDPGNMDLTTMASDVARVSALGTWRYTQGVYQFDPDIVDAVLARPLTLDCAALFPLPEFCCLIDSTTKTKPFFVHLEHDLNSGRAELRFLFFMDNGDLFPLTLHLGEYTLEEGIKKWKTEGERVANLKGHLDGRLPSELVPYVAEAMEPAAHLVQYLCSDATLLSNDGEGPIVPAPKTKKGRTRIAVPKAPRVWRVV